jgi:cell wall-associated NlpC family hydrolase
VFGGLVLLVLMAAFASAAQPGRAQPLSYPDVKKTQWASTYIAWVTDQTVGGQHLLDDFAGAAFKPSDPLTRAQLARVLVLAAKRQDVAFTPVTLSDVPPAHPYYDDIQRALALGLTSATNGAFHPDDPVLVWQADKAFVLMLKLLNPKADWSMLSKLDPVRWRPNVGWRPPAPRYFASEVAARYLGLRFNHPYGSEQLEMFPTDPIRRDEAAYSIYTALHVSPWRIAGLSSFDNVTFPQMSDRQKEIVGFALSCEGYPFVYGGEFPTTDSPYGYQAHGGFDCSGFDWWVMKIHFGYPIPVTQRTAAAMAAAAKPRITRAKLKPCDLIFFGPNGPRAVPTSIYHAALYLGNGWFINSTGSTDGVSLASVDWQGWSWKTDLTWGRRLLKASELPPAPTPSPSPSPSPSSTPSPSASPSPSPSPFPSPSLPPSLP